MQKVYLAGGMRSGWQNKVKEIKGLEFYDPTPKESSVKMSIDQYGTWDLHFVKQSDIVFVYIERTNPSGIGAAIESGYAKGLGKTVILVLEEGNETINDRYLAFFNKIADVSFNRLEEGIEYLTKFA